MTFRADAFVNNTDIKPFDPDPPFTNREKFTKLFDKYGDNAEVDNLELHDYISIHDNQQNGGYLEVNDVPVWFNHEVGEWVEFVD